MVSAPHADPDDYLIVHWSYVGDAAPWQHTRCWKPPAEPDRIAALEQRLKEHIRAQSVLAAALIKRLEALEGLPPDGAIPEGGRGVPGGIAALEQRVAERFATLEQLFWAHKHEAMEGLAPDGAVPEGGAPINGVERPLSQRVPAAVTMRQLLHGSRFRLVVEPR
jgi:hypothetical protein